MDSSVRRLVRDRAGDRCEYCLLGSDPSRLAHHVEHIIARQHGGSDDPSNLALASHRCNAHKGPNLAGIDPLTGDVVPLFHPRRDVWTEHFRYEGLSIVGRNPAGRATVRVLAMNDERRLERRAELRLRGEFP